MQEEQKERVHAYWNRASCGTEFTDHKKFSIDYFQQIESARYALEPEIFSFAQFTRYRTKKVLEVGVGAGTDFTQWVRAGAQAYGIDLTQEAIENTHARLALEQLTPTSLHIADAEALPFEDNFFDLSYSWGVIHHSPHTFVCISEMIRVTKPGGTIKIMVYNLNSLFAFYQYCIHGIKRWRFFVRWKDILYHHQESFGTKAFTQKEIRHQLRQYPVSITKLESPITSHDLLYYKSQPFRIIAHLLAALCGWKHAGWFMLIELKKNES
jgi:ubiquinone/menaquinone biosynthesis C-methylase UbiE